MTSTEFLALRKLQKEGAATDYKVAQFLDMVNAGNRTPPQTEQEPASWTGAP